MPTPPATVEEFKTRFFRDFIYDGSAQDDPAKVLDVDITNALNDGTLLFNSGLWCDDLEKKTAFLFLAAHFLVLNIQGAGGLSGTNFGKGMKSHGGGVTQQKSVGSVSVGYAISPYISNDPVLSQFMRTDYGQKYLQLLTPRLCGNVAVVAGWNDTGAPSGTL